MKKYEIINDSWIKKNDTNTSKNTISGHESLKIISITHVMTYAVKPNLDDWSHTISLTSAGGRLTFQYEGSELEIYKEDLKIFENLIYK
jgi:hypothetical protein